MTPQELRQLRETLALTQRELGERLGLHVNTIWQYEKGWRTIPDAVSEAVEQLDQPTRTTPLPPAAPAA